MRKKCKFSVTVYIEGITSIPLLKGHVFAKLKLKNGGGFKANTKRKEINNFKVQWGETFKFNCKMNVCDASLEDCKLRISIRRETNGGKGSEKYGHADINLAEIAGGGEFIGRYLLKDDKRGSRLGNTIILANTSMTLIEGDPIFRPRVAKKVEILNLSTMSDTEIDTDSPGLKLDSIESVRPNSLSDNSSSEGGTSVTSSQVTQNSPSQSVEGLQTSSPRHTGTFKSVVHNFKKKQLRHRRQRSLSDPAMYLTQNNAAPVPEYHTQSLDRRSKRSPKLPIRTKSYSGSIASVSTIDTLPVSKYSTGSSRPKVQCEQERRMQETRIDPYQLIDQILPADNRQEKDRHDTVSLQTSSESENRSTLKEL